MWFLIPIAFFITAALLSVKFRESICDTIAVTGAIQILFLYVLALFRGMKFIYVSSIATILIFGGLCLADFMFKKTPGVSQKIIHINHNRHSFKRCLQAFARPEVFAFIFIIAVVTFLTRNQIFTWWDDINFWSSDAKQLYYLNGFPGKYGNVSPEFGDYPPVTSIFKWIFLEISSKKYRESLQFAGYYTLNFVFLMPIVKGVSTKLAAPATFLAFMLPGIINGIIFYGTPADITMGIVYGALLYAIWDKDGHQNIFYYGRIALYTAVLLLTKSVGIEWAVFALIFFFMTNPGKGRRASKVKGICLATFFAATFYGSWLLFCFINRRVAKATGLGIRMATGSYVVPANAAQKAWYFFLGLWTMPMHADHNVTFDMPIGVMIVLIFAALILMIKKEIIPHRERKRFALFFVLSGIISYGIIFIAHISLFQAEDQYLDAFAMTNSLARYGAPFTMGSMYLLMGVALTYAGSKRAVEEAGNPDHDDYWKNKRNIIYILIILFVLLNADYVGTYNSLYGYRKTLEEKAAYNADMIDDGGQRFIEALYGHRVLWGHRVLNLRSGDPGHWVHDTYLSKEVSPVPAVYDTLTESDDAITLTDKIRKSHAEYVFAESAQLYDKNAFSGFMENGEEFEFWKLYKVEDTGDSLKLIPVYLY
ncbi:MAG: hypothetical protein K6E70_01395 [Butyrivibrio sp.]|nr:hypothetical protein [Butyrivibrio sp.]